mmetsp:Transcript_22838/g.36469  ORF Transcript_22838/g.36469 Transcript_22838/m.36469 type:complete len:300 (-) Transcript_22838:31-930(-)
MGNKITYYWRCQNCGIESDCNEKEYDAYKKYMDADRCYHCYLKTIPAGRYHSFEKIGRGGFGDVFKAKDRGRKDEWVAIKKIHRAHSSMIQKELALMKKCDSPFVVKLYEEYEDAKDKCTCLVLEYCSGGSIENLAGRCSEKQVITITFEVSCGLKYLHGKGIVHRDIKPANILWTGSKYKVADLGISKDTNYSSAKTKTGTLPFLAPEVLKNGDSSYTAKVDIWALGITLYVLATGSYPWNNMSGSHYALVQEIVGGKPKKLYRYSEKVRKLVNDQCLQRYPSSRPSSDAIRSKTSFW